MIINNEENEISASVVNFESAIKRLDIDLFSKIESQISSADKECLLVVQNAVRNNKESFVYLEIGSYLGGSIQPYFIDPKCLKIFSIDKRPEVQADERYLNGAQYPQNTTQRMLDNLKKLSEKDMDKIVTFDNDAKSVNKTQIDPKPDLCFIDGEHTNSQVISDFIFCKSVIAKDGVIVFHDSDVIFQGIKMIIKKLKHDREVFKAYFLSEALFVIAFMGTCVNSDKNIKLLRRKLFIPNVKRWILWSIFPNVVIRNRLFLFKQRLLKI